MAQGGVFLQILNTGVQDKLLLATSKLEERIKQIRNDYKTRNVTWDYPVHYIDYTHVMFINGRFKPFVSTAFEYKKDSAKGARRLGNILEFELSTFGEFINDTVLHIKLSGLKANNPFDRVRYVSMLGHKLLKKVTLKIANQEVDYYESDDYNAYYEFHIPSEKKRGWLRNIGQEIPEEAFVTADPSADFFREYKSFGKGNQTFKHKHDDVELWIPLLFWFKNIKTALPMCKFPHGQVKIEIELANASDIVGYARYQGDGSYIEPSIDVANLYCNHLYLDPTVTKIFTENAGFTLIRKHGHEKLNSINASPGNEKIKLTKATEALYIAFKPKSNEQLSQYWHKMCQLVETDVKVPVVAKNPALVNYMTGNNNSTSNTVSLSFVSGPVIDLTNDVYKDYDLVITGGFGFDNDNVENNFYKVSSYIGATATFTVNANWRKGTPNSTTTFELYTPEPAINIAKYYSELPTIETLGIKIQNVDIYKDMSERFYNSYLPYNAKNISTPNDRGWYLVNFAINPGDHQPSGHANLSRSNELYFSYSSKFISDNNPVDLIVLSDMIAFLSVDAGTAVTYTIN